MEKLMKTNYYNKVTILCLFIWFTAIMLYSCHPVNAEHEKESAWDLQLMNKYIRCFPKIQVLEIMQSAGAKPLLRGTAEVLTRSTQVIPVEMVFFADTESTRWALVEVGNDGTACIIDMGNSIDFTPVTEDIYKLFGYIPGEKS